MAQFIGPEERNIINRTISPDGSAKPKIAAITFAPDKRVQCGMWLFILISKS